MVYSEVEYLSKYPDPKSTIATYNAIIDALNSSILTGNTVKSYEMDDGQITVKTGFNSITEIRNAVLFYQQRIEIVRGYVNGRKTKFIPCSGLITITR